MILRCCKKSILLSEILPNVRLPEAHNARWLKSSRLGRRSRSDTETQWHIVHPQHNNPLMLRAILAPPSYVSFYDVTPVLYSESVNINEIAYSSVGYKEWHHSVLLHP